MKKFLYLYRFFKSFSSPFDVQKKVLSDILKNNQNSEYGRLYEFSSIHDVQTFQEKVPMVTYEDIEPFIEKTKQGKQGILTSSPVVYFSATSGSLGIRKFIPVTDERIQALHTELLIRGLYAPIVFKNHWLVIFGKILYSCGSYLEGYTEGGIPYGGISGYLAYKGPKTAKKHMAVPPEVFKESNFDIRIKNIAINALLHDIKHMGFTSTIEIHLLFDYIETHKEELIARIEKIHPKRARYLKNLESFSPKHIWPNIEIVNCFYTSTNIHYLKLLEKRLDKKIHIRDAGINASEGRMTVGVCTDDISGYPTTFNNFFEFIDTEDVTGSIKTLDQLETGKTYEVVITTYEGLYRYKTKDIVKVTSRKKNLPLLKFFERKNYINLVGEQASEKDLASSMQRVLNNYKLSANGFVFIPYYKDSRIPRYEILIEFQSDSSLQVDINQFIEDIDNHLIQNIHGYYRSRVTIGKIDKPVLSIVSRGSWEEFNKKQIVNTGQPKHLYLANDPSYRENFIIERTYD